MTYFNIYVKYLLSARLHGLISVHFPSLSPIWNLQESSENFNVLKTMLAKAVIPPLPNVELFVDPYPAPRSHLNNLCP